MLRTFFFIAFYLLFFPSYSQQTATGKVIESRTKLPLSYANVYLKSNSSHGTVSNSEGSFSLSLPIINVDDSLVVSFIGYKRLVMPINNFNHNSSVIVELVENKIELNEIIVFATDTLPNYLKKAFKKIEINYPQSGLLINGLYRETNFLDSIKKFIYFSESLIEFYKPPYSAFKYGPARIIEGGKLELKNRRDYSNIYFYAGLYAPQRFDFVKERIEFINPQFFYKYSYSVEDQVLNGGRKTFIISFKPLKDALYEGKFFIDAESLGYVRAEYNLSPFGLKKDNFINGITSFKFISRFFLIQYELKDALWYNNLIVQNGLASNKKFNNKLRYTNEFVTLNSINSDKNLIKEQDAVPYQAFYTAQESKFTNSYWQKSEVVARMKGLKDTLDLISNWDKLNTVKHASSKSYKQKQILNIVSRISTGLSFGSFSISNNQSFYQLSYPNHFFVEKQIDQMSNLNVYGIDIKYYPKLSYSVFVKYFENISNAKSLRLLSLGIEGSKRLVGRRKPLYFQPGIGIYSSQYYLNLGNTDLISAFNKVNSNEISVGVGQTKIGILGSVEFVYKFHSRFAFLARASSSLFSVEKDKVFVHETPKPFLGSHATSINLNEISFLENTTTQTQSPIKLKDFSLISELGLRFGLIK